MHSYHSVSLCPTVLPEVLSLEPTPLQTVNQSDPAMFQCNATGIPAPTIQWFRGSEELTTASSGEMMMDPDDLNSRIMISDPEQNEYLTSGGYVFSVGSTLTIEPTLGSDSDVYSCNASSEVGPSQTPEEDGEVVELFVQGEKD